MMSLLRVWQIELHSDPISPWLQDMGEVTAYSLMSDFHCARCAIRVESKQKPVNDNGLIRPGREVEVATASLLECRL